MLKTAKLAKFARSDFYFVCAMVVSAVAQWFVYSRISYWSTIKDVWPRDSWVVTNFLLSGLALLLMVPVLRRGRWWQRLFAGLLCIYTLSVILDKVRWSFEIMSQP